MKVADLVRRHGVSEQSIYRWQSKYGGLEVSEMKRLRLLEEENRRLKRAMAGDASPLRMPQPFPELKGGIRSPPLPGN